MSGMKDFSGTGLARWMVGCDTVTSGSNEAALLAQVAEWLEKAGFAVFLDGYDEKDPGKCSLSAHLHPDCGGGALCLAGHVDTVPLGTTPWKHDPFSGEIIDGPPHQGSGSGPASLWRGGARMSGLVPYAGAGVSEHCGGCRGRTYGRSAPCRT